MNIKLRRNLLASLCFIVFLSSVGLPVYAEGHASSETDEASYDRSVEVITIDDFVADPDDPYDTKLNDTNRLDGNIYHHPILGDLDLTMMAEPVEVNLKMSRGLSGSDNSGYMNSDGEFTPSDEYVNEPLNEFDSAQLGENERPTRHIIGADNRSRVYPVPNDYRYRSTVLLYIKYPTGQWRIGTGWTGGNRTIITAGHCVRDNRYGGWASIIQCYAGASGGSNYYYTEFQAADDNNRSQAYCGDNWIGSSYNVHDDWGVIQTRGNIGTAVGWLGRVAANSVSSLTSYTYYTNGYPYDKNSSISYMPDYYMYTTSGKFTGVQSGSTIGVVNFDAMQGQSGSPVYRDYNGSWSAQGIYVADDVNNQNNYVLMLTDPIRKAINNLVV